MKPAIKRLALFLLLFALFIPNPAFAKMKTFIKEYSYQAGDEDSKNSSRVIALREVKRLTLEALGAYLESETEVRSFQLTKDQITTLTAGIVETEIVAEKWDGRVYWLQSKISADSDEVVRSINSLRKDRDKANELELLRKKSDDLLKENERLRKEMASAKDGSREAQKAAYDQSIKELSSTDWLEKGHAHRNRMDFKAAIKDYSRAIELDQSNIDAYYARATAYLFGMKDDNLAMSDFYKLLGIEPKGYNAYITRAWAYHQMKKRDLAIREFGQAIEAASEGKDKAEAYYIRGKYFTNTDARMALNDFIKAVELNPGKAAYYVNRGITYGVLGRDDLQIQDYNKAIETDPKSLYAYSMRGAYFLNQDKPEPAIADLSKAIELDPSEIVNYMDRAAACKLLGRDDQAFKDYSKLIELLGTTRAGSLAANAYYERAQIYALKRNPKMAAADLKKAIAVSRDLKKSAQTESRFDNIRKDPDFINLMRE